MAPSVTTSPTTVKMSYNTVGGQGSPSRGSTSSNNMASPNSGASAVGVGGSVGSGGGSSSEHVMEKRVEELFETQSVSELKAVERKFHSDIERKRQDLRLLVGERYKDVIDVSDKLTGITTHSAQVKSRLERMQTLCDDLRRNQQRQRQLSSVQSNRGGPGYGAGVSSSLSTSTQSLQLACQLRLLSLMPENVLLFLDKSEYVKAAHLVEFSNSLRSSLLGPLNENAHLIKSKFPIVNRISTTHFKSTVRQSLQSHLIKMTQPLIHNEGKISESETQLCSNEDALLFCEIVEAFSILDNCSFLEAIVQTLEIFGDHITHTLTDVESTLSVSDILTIASKLYYFAVYCTALSVNNMSRRNDVGPAPITFDELYPSQVQLKSFLPANVTATSFERKTLSHNEDGASDVNATQKLVLAAINDQLVNKVRRHVEEQLGYVKSVKSLTNIKTKLLQIEDGVAVTAKEAVRRHLSMVPSSEENNSNDEMMTAVTYWEQLFEPLFTSCAKKLLKKSVLEQWNSEARSLLEERIVPLIDTTSNVSYAHVPNGTTALAEVDMPTHVWSEELNFVVHSSEQQTKDAAKTSEADSQWKISGRSAAQAETPAVVSVCRKIDEIVEALCESGSEFFSTTLASQQTTVLHDAGGSLSSVPISMYGSGRSGASEKVIRDKSKTAMEEMNQQITVILLQKLVDFFIDMNRADEKEAETNGDISSYEVQLRLFNYLLCNANCLRDFERNEMTSDCFVQLERLMSSLHKKWLDTLCKETLSCLKSSLISATMSEEEKSRDKRIKQQHAQLLAACWEQVDIEEESEDGTPIITKLPIPIKASYAVHDMLFILTNALNRVTPLVTSDFIHRQQRSHAAGANINRTGPQSKTPEDNFYTKPFLIATEINDNLCRDVRNNLNDKLVEFYEDMLYSEVSSELKNTKLMIQIIYDIKLLSALLSNANESYSSSSGVNVRNQKILSTVISKYEQHVDPFDYDVYAQHLSDKLSVEINQSQHLYGYLLAPSGGVASKALSLSGAALQGSSSGKATTYHNLCQLVQNPIKFQPLSVPHSAASFGLKRANASSSLLQGGGGGTGAVGLSGQSVAAAATPEKLQTGASLLKGWLKG